MTFIKYLERKLFLSRMKGKNKTETGNPQPIACELGMFLAPPTHKQHCELSYDIKHKQTAGVCFIKTFSRLIYTAIGLLPQVLI